MRRDPSFLHLNVVQLDSLHVRDVLHGDESVHLVAARGERRLHALGYGLDRGELRAVVILEVDRVGQLPHHLFELS